MSKDIKEIIKQSSYQVIDGRYIYSKVRSIPKKGSYFMISRDKDEITVVAEEKQLKNLELIEKNKETYKLIALNVSVPFYAVGFLATVSNAIAKQNMNILIISTYSKDYILVREEHFEKAISVLDKLGFNKT